MEKTDIKSEEKAEHINLIVRAVCTEWEPLWRTFGNSFGIC